MLDLIAAHRRALTDALASLTAEQWRGPSLCAGWTPAHVLAHLTMPFRISAPEFLAGIERCGGDFTKFSDQVAERDSSLPPSSLIAILAENADNPWEPPGGGLIGALSHDVIHGLDIAWPHGLRYDIPADAMRAVLDSVTSPLPPAVRSPLAADRARGDQDTTIFGFALAGIQVIATDLGWDAGTGAEVAGTGRDLLPLLAGRQIPVDRFRGSGTARLWSMAAQ